MPFFRFNRFIYLFLLAVGVFFLIFVKDVPLVSGFLLRTVSFFVKLPSEVGESLRKGMELYVGLVKLKEENERLRKENEALRSKLVELNERLRFFKALKKTDATDISLYPRVKARVIYKPFSPFENYLIVQVMERDKRSYIKPEMPVVSIAEDYPGALVGQVVSTSKNGLAKVLPITAPVSAVDVISSRSRERGLLRGRGKGRPCLLDYVPTGADIKEGDILITSGMDALFPKGLRVGRVIRVLPERRQGFFENIEVEPFAKVRSVEYVYIILKRRARNLPK